MARIEIEWSRYLETLLLVPLLEGPLQVDGRLTEWTARHRLPPLDVLQGRNSPGDFFLGWRPEGLAFALDLPASGPAGRIREPLWLELLLDTQPQAEKRWDETCHHLVFSLRDTTDWIATPRAWTRDPESAELEQRSDLPTAAIHTEGRHTAEFFLPGEALYRYRGKPFQELRFAFRCLLSEGKEVGGSLPPLSHAERLPGCWPLIKLTEG